MISKAHVLLDKNSRNDTSLVIANLNESIILDSSCVDVLLLRADLLFDRMNYNQARRDYNKSASINKEISYPYYKVGLCYEMDEDFQNAIKFYEMATMRKTKGNYTFDYYSINPQLTTDEGRYDVPLSLLIFRQAVCYYYLRNLSMAFTGFTYCIQNGFREDESYYYRGAVNFEQSKKDSACSDWKRASSLGFKNADSVFIKYCQK